MPHRHKPDDMPYQITERPADPPPMRSGFLRTPGEVTFEPVVAPRCATCGDTGKVGTGQPSDEGGEAWDRCGDCPDCPECGAGICQHATDAMRGHEAEAERLRALLMERPTRAEFDALAVVSRVQRETLDAIEAGATTGAGTLESARAAASYLRIRFDLACRQRDEAAALLAEVVNGPSALFEPADYSATVKKAREYLARHAPKEMQP